MNPYFICSLPRSRTAWLANFLCYGPSHCFHEPFNEYAIPDLPVLFGSMQRDYVGISDALTTLYMDDLVNVFPSAKIIVIRRPIDEVDQSLTRIGLPCRPLLNRLEAALDVIQKKYESLVMDFHKFDSAKIWYHLIPEVPLNRERTKMLESFVITVPKKVSVRKAIEFLKKNQLIED